MPAPSPAQIAIKLQSVTLEALRGQRPRNQVRNLLSDAFAKEPLASWIAALTGAIDGYRGSAAVLMAASESVLVGASEAERAIMLSGVADIAHEVGDLATEIASRQEAIYAQRLHGNSTDSMKALSSILFKQAILYAELGDHPASVSLLEEVVELDQQTSHPDTARHRQALDAARQRISKAKVSKLHEHIIEWKDNQTREPKQLVALINMIISTASDALRGGSQEERDALAEDLALLRAAGPMHIVGVADFLHVLQLWLRDEPGMAKKADALQKTLPKEFHQKLLRVRG